MRSIAVIIFFVALYESAVAVQFHDCGWPSGKVSSIKIGGCDSSMARCPMKQGTDESMEVEFTANVDTSAATIVLSGIFGGTQVIQWQKVDACAKGAVTCPVKSGSTNNFKFSIPISSAFPKVTVDVRVELQDANGKDLFCQQWPAQIE